MTRWFTALTAQQRVFKLPFQALGARRSLQCKSPPESESSESSESLSACASDCWKPMASADLAAAGRQSGQALLLHAPWPPWERDLESPLFCVLGITRLK